LIKIYIDYSGIYYIVKYNYFTGCAVTMDTVAKLDLLSGDSQYDLACACGTGKDGRRTRGLDGKWLYPVPGSGIMLKTLLTNTCSNDCKY